ncbi:hypothetical protein [Solibacillus sp. FSL H8-0538]|uniref:hypothetical protein n=1 Tax=Solibacillus sp. FSL H8-0538 TaxID=2921400 RepID=UPI0030F6D0BD
MIWWIITAEIAFWIAIIAGLFTRYILKWHKVSIVLFLLTPLIDLALIVLTAIDLKKGTNASAVHGIAAIYIGISIAYGKTMIAMADEKFQTWVLKKKSNKVRLKGKEKGVYEVKMWARHIAAYIIGVSLLWLMIQFIGQQGDTLALYGVIKWWGLVLLIDGAISLSYILFPKGVKR